MYDSTYADMTTFASVATIASLISTYSMIFVAFYVLIIVAQWKIFVKAGQGYCYYIYYQLYQLLAGL